MSPVPPGKAVRRLALALLAFLPLQFAFSVLVSEPYPAVLLPGFGRVLKAGDSSVFLRPDISASFADGARLGLSPELLLGHRGPPPPEHVVRNMFYPSGVRRYFVPETGSGQSSLYDSLKRLQLWLNDTFVFRRRQALGDLSDHPELRQWLRARLARVRPETPATGFEVAWLECRLTLGSPAPARCSPKERFQIDLRTP